MGGILEDFLQGLLAGFLGNASGLAGFGAEAVLYPEKSIGFGFASGVTVFANLTKVLINVGTSVILFRFVKKGLETYGLYTDGDPDADPVGLVTNFFKAMAAALCFQSLYPYVAQIASGLLSQVLGAMTNYTGTGDDFFSWASVLQGLSSIVFWLGIIFFIAYIVLLVKFMMRGIELFVLRIGFPLACSGLIDNDKGVFEPYCKKIMQILLGMIAQIMLANIAIGLFIGTHYFWAIAAMLSAHKIPAVLSEFIYGGSSSGGGMGSKLMAANQVGSLLRGLGKV
jgi:hypothetical protein